MAPDSIDLPDEWLDMLIQQCNAATPDAFRRRLENATLLYAFIEKRFRERFPVEYAAWEAAQPHD